MRLRSIVLSLFVVLSICIVEIPPSLSSSDPTPHDPEQVSFTNVTFSAGLGGVGGQFLSWTDYNNDGLQDLLVNGRRLFRNNGPPAWDFTDVSSQAGISGGSYGTWADWNNDGFLDFYCSGSDKLYMNNGPPDWDFSDVTASSQIPQETYSTGSAWADYDQDGDVDIYKLRGEDWNDGDPIYYPDRFYRNNGDGTFTDVTDSAGVSEESDPKYGRGAAWADFDEDGDQDLYISNYRQQFNYLYRNNGDGTFTDVASQLGVADGPPFGEGGNLDPYDRAGHGVGSIWGDYDNDGYLDLWVTNLNHKDARTSDDSLLYHNDGPPTYSFTNRRDESGIHIKPYVAPNEGDELFVGCAWGDYDNDGDLDLYLPQIYDIDYAYSFLYENNGDGSFTDVTVEASVRVWDTYAGAWCDYDNDGDLDLITSGRDSGGNADPHFVHLFRNDGVSGNWLHLNLKGDGIYSNSAAIGARVTLTTDSGVTLIREVEGGMGTHGHQNSLTLEFGLGDYTGTVDLEIRWPQNKVQFISDIPINQVFNITDQSAGDLVILGIDYDNQDPIMGEFVRLSADVENIGSTKINTAEVKYYLDTISPSTKIDPTFTVTDLLPSEQEYTYVDWNTAGVSGSHMLYVMAEITDPPPTVTSNIMSRRIYIRPENVLPTAALSANKTSIRKGESVLFDGSNSTDDTQVVEYLFDFGDGYNSGWITDDTIAHTYDFGGDYPATLTVRDDDNGESQNAPTIQIEVRAKPVAALSSLTPMIYKGGSVTFNGSESFDEGGAIVEYNFDFGDGESTGWMDQQEVSHIYLSVGTYAVKLKVRDDDFEESENTAEVVVEVDARPQARLSADRTVIYKEESVNFDASQSIDEDGIVVEYLFDFGDGENSGWISQTGAEHQYLQGGVYYATLSVRDDEGHESVNLEEVEVEVRVTPTAALSANLSVIYKGEGVTFNASLSSDEEGNIESYLFDFGDGGNSGWISESVVVHTYDIAGDYNATVMVMDDDGDTSENLQQVSIEVRAKPHAHLSVSPSLIFGNENVTFDSQLSYDEEGEIVEYLFDFGDGVTSGWIAESTYNHSYSSHGTYNATLTVRDDDGDEDSYSLTIEVSAKPLSHLTSDSPSVLKGETVLFNGSLSQDPDGEVTQYNFDFGDGAFSGWVIDPLITHVYAAVGIYNITLRVRDDEGFESTEAAHVQIRVRSCPKAILRTDTTDIEAGASITFEGSDSYDTDGSISAYNFSYGDGDYSGWISKSGIVHVYTQPGEFVASLEVRDDDGEVSTNRASVVIKVEVANIRPEAQIISISPNPSTAGRDVEFSGIGYDEDGSISIYLWTSDKDGELSSSQSFVTSTLSAGNHIISLKVRDDAEDWSAEVTAILKVKEENELPAIDIKTPGDSDKVSGVIIISGFAEDPDGEIESVEVRVDEGSWATLEGTDFWSYDLDTSTLIEGRHTIFVRAYDGEDYHQESIDIRIGSDEDDGGVNAYLIWAVVGAAILIVVILGSLISVTRKKSQGYTFVETETSQEAGDDELKESPPTRMNL